MPQAGRYKRAEQDYNFMPFGKHSGEMFEDIEPAYLQWVLQDKYEMLPNYPGLERCLRKFMAGGQTNWNFNDDDERTHYQQSNQRQQYRNPPPNAPKARGVDKEFVSAVIAAGRKALANKYHPDINKSPDATEKMQKANAAADWLEECLKKLS